MNITIASDCLCCSSAPLAKDAYVTPHATLILKECLYVHAVAHRSVSQVENACWKISHVGKRVERPVAITYRNSFKSFTRRKSHVGRGFHASGKRTSGKVHALGNVRRENERQERG